jgi:WD40 repeat protein
MALSGGADKTVRLWDLNSGAQTASVQAPGDYVSSVAFSSDGSRALFGASNGSVSLWQLQ